jgi:peptidoglycan/xylan/chitin deacetylase (PgdA/CDA1 family)
MAAWASIGPLGGGRGREGHAFASHTWDHAYWRADLQEGNSWQFRIRPSAGDRQAKPDMDRASIATTCAKRRSVCKCSPGKRPCLCSGRRAAKPRRACLRRPRQCGFAHVGWADAGFLGDELPSDHPPQCAIAAKALKNIRSGDILMAHLGIWSRQDPWAPAVLEPLIVGLKARGLCFATLREHPAYRDWVRQRPLNCSVLPDSRQ